MIRVDNNRLQFHTQHLEISTRHSSLEAARKTLQIPFAKQTVRAFNELSRWRETDRQFTKTDTKTVYGRTK